MKSEKIEINLTDARFYAYHGVTEQERKTGNQFEVNISVCVEVSEAMRCDSLSGTVSYADLFIIAKERMAIASDLLEKVAIDIGERIKQRWPSILEGYVEIIKLSPPISGFTGKAGVKYFL